MIRVAFLSAFCLWPALLLGQPVDSLSERASVSLLTMLPGSEVYSQFGHSAYRIQDPETGLDKTYNFGTFDFDQPLFVVRFVRGQLDYVLDTAPFALEVEKYASLGRPMIEQRLALPIETVRTLYELLEINALPENRAYRYDFFFDNCSTRLLDVLDSALVGSGHGGTELADTETADSFRDLTNTYVMAEPLLRLGINLGLGLPADRRATARERSFLPLELMRELDRSSLDGRRLVVATDTVVVVPGYVGEQPAFDWPLVAGWLAFFLGAIWTIIGGKRGEVALRLGRKADSFLFVICGIAGIALAGLWLATEHAVTGPNLNLLWAWPTHLIVARSMSKPSVSPWLRGYLALAGATAISVCLLWMVLPQALPAPIFPVSLLLATRALARLYSSRPIV